MARAVKRLLSGSTNGRPILVTDTDSNQTGVAAIHTAVSGTTAGSYDEVWIWAQNNHTANVVLTIEFGGTSTSDTIIVTIPYKSGLVPVIPGLPLQNSLEVRAYAATGSVIALSGFVNRITD